jgi:hypothetical protein
VAVGSAPGSIFAERTAAGNRDDVGPRGREVEIHPDRMPVPGVWCRRGHPGGDRLNDMEVAASRAKGRRNLHAVVVIFGVTAAYHHAARQGAGDLVVGVGGVTDCRP